MKMKVSLVLLLIFSVAVIGCGKRTYDVDLGEKGKVRVESDTRKADQIEADKKE